MSRAITSEPVMRFSGPPAERMAGRPMRATVQRAGNYTPKAKAAAPKVSAATEARANSFLDREALLDAAMHEGVIGGGLRAHYAECYDSDPEGTRSYLQSLGLRGGGAHSASAAATSDRYDERYLSEAERSGIEAARVSNEARSSRAASQDSGYMDTHLSSAERDRIAAAREGRKPRIINGGL